MAAKGNQSGIKNAIQDVIRSMMDRVMERVLVEDPFDKHAHRSARPLYAALVPDEIFKGSHFERRFVTPFGHVWERLAVVAARQSLGFAEMDHVIRGSVKRERLRRVAEVLDSLEHPGKSKSRTTPKWNEELAYVLEGKGKEIPVTIVCDVYTENRRTGRRQAFELKSPTPNSDISKVSKEKLLKLSAMEPQQVDEVYFALPFNPYGQRHLYAWDFPARWFNMREDSVVLIGDEFWDKLGGAGTYNQFISAVNEVGPYYRDRIYREYLGITPPPDSSEVRL